MVEKKCGIICDKGFEETVSEDIKKNYDFIKKTKVNNAFVEFSIDEKEPYKKLAEICYTYQGAIKVISDIKHFQSDNIEKISENFENYELPLRISDKKSNIMTIRKGDHNYKSTQVTDILIEKTKIKNFTYKNPDIQFTAFINQENGYFGLDISGRNLTKRDYRVFLGSDVLRSTIAYNMIIESDYDKTKTLLDPFMGSGTIPIEAAILETNFPPFYYSKEKFIFRKTFPEIDWDSFLGKIDQRYKIENTNIYGYDSLFKYLSFSQKNAKIAGINKALNLSKCEIDWIDTKLEKESVDMIITQPPLVTEKKSKTKIMKTYKQFFKRSEDILKKGSIIKILINDKTHNSIKHLYEEKYKEISIRNIYEGKQELLCCTLKLL
ncbi:MAG: methyltransferase [Nanobdellota archaeon]